VTVAFDNLTLSQRVYEHLREEILADHLLPGTELSEVALSKELAISRGPIREAMGRLSAEGLITMRPRRRAEVRSLTPQELIDAYQVREALEVMAVRLAIPRLTEADLARLDQLMERMAGHIAEGAVKEFFAANVEFHETLCELSGNPKLQEVHHRLEGEIGRFQSRTLALRGSMDDSLTEHRAILAAIRLRDVDRAAALTADHIRVPAQRLQAALRDEAPVPVEPAGASLAEGSLGEGSPAAVSRAESSGAGASRGSGSSGASGASGVSGSGSSRADSSSRASGVGASAAGLRG
jgi:DNA-binding GntR family transcriptional regulator